LCTGQLAMVKDRVTTMHREFAPEPDSAAIPVLQEVA
jgi:hypothetical protein